MEKEIKRLIDEFSEQSKVYPKMWTVDVIRLLNHLLDETRKVKQTA